MILATGIENKTEIFLKCMQCKKILFDPETCTRCKSIFHKTCIKNKCNTCTELENIENKPTRISGTIYKAKTSESILEVKKNLQSVENAYKYLTNSGFGGIQHKIAYNFRILCGNCKTRGATKFFQKPLCNRCYNLFNINAYCPICNISYDPEDYSTEMICCDFCLRWIHYDCDSSIKVNRDILNAEYCCKKCKEISDRFKQIRVEMTTLKDEEAKSCRLCFGLGTKDSFFSLIKDEFGYKHEFCTSVGRRCQICRDYNVPPTVRCCGCPKGYEFHVGCSEGLFRQGNGRPSCNEHFRILEDKSDKRQIENLTKFPTDISINDMINHHDSSGFIERGCSPVNYCSIIVNHKLINSFINGNVVYSELIFLRIFYSNQKCLKLSFEVSNGFLLDGCKVEVEEIRRVISIDVLKNDVFLLKSQEYKNFRKNLKSDNHDKLLAEIMKIIKFPNFTFGF